MSINGAVVESTAECGLREQLERYHSDSFGWAMHCCRGRVAEAEDVLQEAYLSILSRQAQFHGRSSFKTWLFAVIRTTAAQERRRQWFRFTGLVRYDIQQPKHLGCSMPADRIAREQDQLVLRKTLQRLPRRQHEVLHLVFYQELTIQQAAEVLGISLGSARQHYERGKQRLRELLRTGGSHEER